jgi:hypothetical protein
VILDVAGDQASKLAAARQKDADLARKEAELTAGGALPPSKRDARGEVFTLGGDAFGSGKATLTASAKSSLQALGAYIAAAPTGRDPHRGAYRRAGRSRREPAALAAPGHRGSRCAGGRGRSAIANAGHRDG